MAVDDPDQIDLLVTDKEKTFVRLVIADHLDWEELDEGHHLELLQNKLNRYLDFVESGELIQTRPDLQACPVIIQVAAKFPPNEEAAKFYRLAAPAVAEAGISLELEVGRSGIVTRF